MTGKDTVNIASHLPHMAKIKPCAPAVVFPECSDSSGRTAYTHFTLKQLNEASDDVAHGLRSIGIGPGTRTALMVKPCLDFFALTFGLFKAGAVPVMIDPGIGVNNMGPSLKEAAPEAFIGIPKAQIARIILGWARDTIKTVITVGKKMPLGGMTLEEVVKRGNPGKPFEIDKTDADEPAAVLFTSGSTGPSKGALYTHGMFNAQVRALKDIYHIEPGEMDLSTFPLFALFGPALGMASIIPPMDSSRPGDADPALLFKTIEDFGPTNIFASPVLIHKLGIYGEKHNIRLSSLKRVISAGAPARIDDLERFSKLLPPGVEIFTPYGATEALPVSSIGSNEILNETGRETLKGKGNCVGMPAPEIQAEIIKITDEPIPAWSDELIMPKGQIGEIAVKGPVVTGEYFNRPDATAKAKIPCADGGFFHRMGDVGYMDEKGRLWFCGRKNHRVETEDAVYFTIPCEAIFNCHKDVKRTALVGVKKDGKTIPLLWAEPYRHVEQSQYERIRTELLELGSKWEHTSAIKEIMFHHGFPVDVRHNAKIFREKLTALAQRRLS